MNSLLNMYKSVFIKVSKSQLLSHSRLARPLSTNHAIKKYDCIVVGLGAHGSSTLYHLARNGLKVLGIEQFKVAHSLGSSHGLSRIIRLTYFENPAYVALLRRASKLWRDLEQESGQVLFFRTGSLDIGTSDSRIFTGSKLSCEKENLDHEIFDQSQLAERFPGWHKIPKNSGLMGIFQPEGGILHPEKCIEAYINLARHSYRAQVNENETVTNVELKGKDEAVVHTKLQDGNLREYVTSRVILSPGPWLSGLINKSPSLAQVPALAKIAGLLNPERNVVIWYRPRIPQFYATEIFPVFVLEYLNEIYYGFPITGLASSKHEKFGFKIGKYHHCHEKLTQDMLHSGAEWRTKFTKEDEEVIAKAVKDLLPDAYGPILKQIACIFTNTPDENFIIDSCPDPKFRSLALVSACAGHGFKFSSVVGEIMATLIISSDFKNPSKHYKHASIDWLRAKRFY